MESKRGIRESIAEDVIRQKMDAILDEKQKKELKLWEDGRKVGKKYEDLFDAWTLDDPEARHAAMEDGSIGLLNNDLPFVGMDRPHTGDPNSFRRLVGDDYEGYLKSI